MVPADSPRIPRVRGYSGCCWASFGFAHGGITLYAAYFHLPVLASFLPYRSPTTPPGPKTSRFGLFPVRSPLLRESLLFSLPAATKMFQFAAFAHLNRCDGSSIRRVAPFGDLRIKGHLHLPGAFRSLSRPSSPSRAKASACCPFLLLLCLVPVLIPSGTRPVLLKVILRLSVYFLRSHATKACSLRLYYYLKLLNNVKDRFLKAREACSEWDGSRLRTGLFLLSTCIALSTKQNK